MNEDKVPQNSQLDKNVTGYLHSLLSTPGAVTVDASQSEQVEISKKWLADINNDRLLVNPAEPDSSNEDDKRDPDYK